MAKTDATVTPLDLPRKAIEAFCRRWRITELALFGSILGDDFGPESDIDFLVTFAPDARSTLFDLVEMEEELGALLGRPVDLVSKRAVERSENWIRRRAILEAARPYYVA
jgi:predicted nucleotidyltransferase